ncbi:hypothetical protein K0M31_009515 [Melipona bicolor]|uniref:Uncharacterized protein n=1 Tax=Melipona bicolor TaxID=60889 RepID=A0AA40FND1_9HYME|nr:hypothetical protein K0M31_009515 [Melipona bicolor]
MAMERLFAMVDKRTLDIFHCQHSVGPTPLLSTTRYESKNNIGSDERNLLGTRLCAVDNAWILNDDFSRFDGLDGKRNFVDYLPGPDRGKERYRGWRKFALGDSWIFIVRSKVQEIGLEKEKLRLTIYFVEL